MLKLKKFLFDRRLSLAKLVRVVAILALLFGAYRLVFYSLPMQQQNFQDAAQSMAADKAVALYDAALAQYQHDNYPAAAKLLTEAYSAVTSEGELSGERKNLAAQIKFIEGNNLVKSGSPSHAVEAYKESLRLNPNNLYAKYNLELLLQMNGGKGPAEDPGGSGPGKGGKKGI